MMCDSLQTLHFCSVQPTAVNPVRGMSSKSVKRDRCLQACLELCYILLVCPFIFFLFPEALSTGERAGHHLKDYYTRGNARTLQIKSAAVTSYVNHHVHGNIQLHSMLPLICKLLQIQYMQFPHITDCVIVDQSQAGLNERMVALIVCQKNKSNVQNDSFDTTQCWVAF